MKKAFSDSDTKLEKWDVITTEEQANEVIKASKNSPQLVYKHSHRCSICLLAQEEIEANFETINKSVTMNFINVVKSRSASDAFTNQLEVRHESPQVLIIYKGKVIWNGSHHSIKTDAILEALNGLN